MRTDSKQRGEEENDSKRHIEAWPIGKPRESRLAGETTADSPDGGDKIVERRATELVVENGKLPRTVPGRHPIQGRNFQRMHDLFIHLGMHFVTL